MARSEIISYSRLAEWTTCRYRWKLRYIDHITRRVDFRAPTLGSAVHVGMACGLLEKDYVAGIDQWKEEYLQKHILEIADGVDELIAETTGCLNQEIEDMTNEVTSTAKEITGRALKVFGPDQWEPVLFNKAPMVEIELRVPIRGWGGYRGILDLVAKEKSTGFVWVVDHKVRNQLQPVEAEEVNLQMASYQYLALRHGIQTIGSLTNQILAKVPSIPQLNKNGTMSRARIATDWSTYKQALISNNLDPEDYAEEMVDKLNVEFQRESRAYRSEEEVRNTWSNVIQKTAWDMTRKSPHYWRKMGHMNCQSCWARDFCLEELRGGDTEYLLRGGGYMIDTGREDINGKGESLDVSCASDRES